MQNQTMQPVSTDRRLIHLDVLRGFALLGILLVNFEWFTRPMLSVVLRMGPELSGADRAVDWIIHWLAEGKFYPLFAVLFGAGFALMAGRAEALGSPLLGNRLRRMLVLAGFGVAHIALVWAADILLIYALAAFLMMLLFHRTPVKRLWKWGLAFILAPVFFLWLSTGLIGLAQQVPELNAELASDTASARQFVHEQIRSAEGIHAEGGYIENLHQRWRDYLALFGYGEVVIMVLGFFMLGRWLIEAGILRQVSAHARFLQRWRLCGLAFGLALAAGATALMYQADLIMPNVRLAAGYTLLTTAGIVLSLGYLATVVLAADRLRWLAPAGRMALTNYLVQSVFWTFVFYGYGLGLWGQVPRVWHPLLVILFFAIQVAFSHWWLARFRFGPAEWLWRSLTYWRIQPMRLAGP